ncbi:MAG: TorF family putative porin [Gammaproteobacteria bacterium]
MGFSKQYMKRLISGTAIIAACANTPFAVAQENKMEAEATATSTYLWRGIALSSDATLQGRLTLMDPTGIHAEFFGSNVFGGSELQIAAGYQGQADYFKYDAGVRFYYLPQYESSNYAELYFGVKHDNVGGKLSFSPDSGTYLEAYMSLPAFNQWNVDVHVGRYTVDENDGGATIPLKDYTDASVALSSMIDTIRFEFKLSGTTLSDGEAKLGRNTDNLRTVISISKKFSP